MESRGSEGEGESTRLEVKEGWEVGRVEHGVGLGFEIHVRSDEVLVRLRSLHPQVQHIRPISSPSDVERLAGEDQVSIHPTGPALRAELESFSVVGDGVL